MPSVYDEPKVEDDLLEASGISKAEQAQMEDRAIKGAGDAILAQENAAGSTATDQSESLYNPGGSTKKGLGIRFSSKQKKGGIVGLVIGLALAGMSTISLGPLQIIHFAQMIQGFHFADQEADTNKRTSRITKYFLYDKQVEKTRLTIIQNRIATKFEAKLAKTGTSMTYDGRGNLKSIVIDTQKAGYKNPADPRAIPEVAAAHGVDPKYVEVGEKAGTLEIKSAGTTKADTKLVSTVVDINSSHGKIMTAYIKRLQKLKVGSSFNLLTKIDRGINRGAGNLAGEAADKFKALREARSARLTSQNPPVTIEAAKPKPGDPAPTEADKAKAAETVEEAKNPKESSNRFKSGGAKALGGASAVAIVCVVNHIINDVDGKKKLNNSLARMETTIEVVSVAAKAQAGDDIDVEALGEISKSLNSDKVDGKTSSWSQASSIQYSQGKSGGTRLTPELDPNPEKSEVAKALQEPTVKKALDTVCPVLENAIVQIALSVTNIATSAAMFVFAPILTNKITEVAVGEAPDISAEKYRGAMYGEAAFVGGLEAANQSSASVGGRVQSEPEAAILAQEVRTQKTINDKDRSIADRYLNPNKYDTAVARVIDTAGTSNTESMLARIPKIAADSFGYMFGSLSRKASAEGATLTRSQAFYDIPKVGFEPGLLESEQFDNPYKNAEEASIIMKGPKKEEYKKWLGECNLIDVVETNEGGSTIIDYRQKTGAVGDYNALPDYCKNSNDAAFVKVRVAVLDTITMQAFACTQFDDETSCSDIDSTASTVVADATPTVASTPNKEGWAWPFTAADNPRGGPCYGGSNLHGGIDINFSKSGVKALAAHNGKVVKVKKWSGNPKEDPEGNFIMIQSLSGEFYNYQHLESISVKEGDEVTSGSTVVGIVGRTGDTKLSSSTKGHLHFVISSSQNFGGYGKVADSKNPTDFLPTEAPGGYKCY